MWPSPASSHAEHEMIMRKLYIKRRITRKLSLQFSKHEQEIGNDNGKVVYIANDNERVVDSKGKKEALYKKVWDALNKINSI